MNGGNLYIYLYRGMKTCKGKLGTNSHLLLGLKTDICARKN